MTSDVPEGFDATYPCKNHAERDAVAPIALRQCEECLELARQRYAAQIERTVRWRQDHDVTTWGEPIDERKVRGRKVELI